MKILSLIYKELLVVLKDRRSRISVTLPPIIQLFIFAFAATLDVKNASIGIVNRDNGEQAFELIERFEGAPLFGKITHLESMDLVGPFLDNQRGILVVSFDEQFSRDLNAKKAAKVQILGDGRKSNTAQIVSGYASQIIEQYNRDFCKKAGIAQQNVVLMPRNWFNPNIIYLWYNIPCLVATLVKLSRELRSGL
jgi:ABC-2 type transport system permease protein